MGGRITSEFLSEDGQELEKNYKHTSSKLAIGLGQFSLKSSEHFGLE